MTEMSRLGQLLKERGLITDQDYAAAEALRRDKGGAMGPTLVRMGAVSEDALLQVLSEQLGIPLLSATAAPTETEVREPAVQMGDPISWLIHNETIF